MNHVLLVACGGALGAVTRYLLSGWITLHLVGSRFPTGTLAVNLLGCFAIGLLAGLSQKHHVLSPEINLLLTTGFLGGFTTFSAFGLESFMLYQRGEALIAGSYILASLLLGLLCVWLGFQLIPDAR